MVVGCLTAAVGVVTGLLAGAGRLDWLVLAVVVPPTLLGGWLGAWLTGKISKAAVQRFAGWVVLATGAIMIGQGGMSSVRRPRAVTPPVVEEWEYDEWFDFDYQRTEDKPPPPSFPDRMTMTTRSKSRSSCRTRSIRRINFASLSSAACRDGQPLPVRRHPARHRAAGSSRRSRSP